MKALLAAALASTLLAGAAVAQTSTTTTTTTDTTGSTSTTVIEQSAMPKVREYITTQKTTSTTLPSGVEISVGRELPETVTLHEFGADVGVSKYKYVVVNGRAAIVDPSSRKIVQVIETN